MKIWRKTHISTVIRLAKVLCISRTEVLCDELVGLDALGVDADGAGALGVDLEVLLHTY